MVNFSDAYARRKAHVSDLPDLLQNNKKIDFPARRPYTDFRSFFHRNRGMDMDQKKLALWLKGITVVLCLMLLCVFFVLCPMLDNGLSVLSPANRENYRAFFVAARVMLLPCFAALWFFWRICCNIGADRSFCAENVRYLKNIAVLALGDTALCFLTAVGFACLACFGAAFYAACLIGIVIGITVAVAALVLAHLTEKAAALKAENDLTV